MVMVYLNYFVVYHPYYLLPVEVFVTLADLSLPTTTIPIAFWWEEEPLISQIRYNMDMGWGLRDFGSEPSRAEGRLFTLRPPSGH